MSFRVLFFIAFAVAVFSLATGMDDSGAKGVSMPLIAAVKKGDLDEVSGLLARDVDANAPDENDRTALMYAASHEESRDGNSTLALSMVRLLLNSGANVNMTSRSGETAIMFAAVKVNADVVEFLLARGAKPHVKVLKSDTIEVSGGSFERRPMTTFRLTVGSGFYRGEYTSGEFSSAWSRPASPRANSVFDLLKAMSNR